MNIPGDNNYLKFRRYYTALEPEMQKPQNRVYTALIFSFLAISLFGWFAIRPTIQTILYLRREIADKTIVNQQMEDKITDLIQARTQMDTIQPKLHMLSEAIPENPQALDVVLQLRNIAGTTEATVSSVNVANIPLRKADATPKAKAGPSLEFTLDAQLKGGFSEIESILGNIIGMRRIVTIQSINLSMAEKTSGLTPFGNRDIQLSAMLTSYYK